MIFVFLFLTYFTLYGLGDYLIHGSNDMVKMTISFLFCFKQRYAGCLEEHQYSLSTMNLPLSITFDSL